MLPDGFERLRYARIASKLLQHFNALLAELFVTDVNVGQVERSFAAYPAEKHSRVRGLDDVETSKIVVPRLFVCQAMTEVKVGPRELESFAVSVQLVNIS